MHNAPEVVHDEVCGWLAVCGGGGAVAAGVGCCRGRGHGDAGRETRQRRQLCRGDLHKYDRRLRSLANMNERRDDKRLGVDVNPSRIWQK